MCQLDQAAPASTHSYQPFATLFYVPGSLLLTTLVLSSFPRPPSTPLLLLSLSSTSNILTINLVRKEIGKIKRKLYPGAVIRFKHPNVADGEPFVRSIYEGDLETGEKFWGDKGMVKICWLDWLVNSENAENGKERARLSCEVVDEVSSVLLLVEIRERVGSP